MLSGWFWTHLDFFGLTLKQFTTGQGIFLDWFGVLDRFWISLIILLAWFFMCFGLNLDLFQTGFAPVQC